MDQNMSDRSSSAPINGLHDRAGHLARRFQQAAVANFTRRNGTFGVTSVQYAVLISVRERPELDQSSLASLIAFDKSTLGVVVDKLEKRGTIKRTRDIVDKRRYTLRITAKGRNMLSAMQASVWKSESELLSPLSAAEQKKLKSLLSKLLNGQVQGGKLPAVSKTKTNGSSLPNPNYIATTAV
jgi:DNA-binding MarR family transcriptional regulator